MLVDTPPLLIRHSRCLRMRFNRSECLRCAEACPQGAIKLEGGISIDQTACTGCLRCSAVCPTGAWEVRGCDFNCVVSALGKSTHPVLGCSGFPNSKAHAQVPCLGMLSPEHLIFMGFFLNRPLQLNLTYCEWCENREIVFALREAVGALRDVYGIESVEVVPVENADALDYRDTVLDRRGFFSALKENTRKSVVEIAGNFASPTEAVSYSQKSLSAKRELFNRAYLSAGESGKAMFLSMFYEGSVCADCNICATCVGVCPRGALKVQREGNKLLFLSSHCSGCGLCRESCKTKALHIRRGFQGTDPFDYQSLHVKEQAGKKDVLRSMP